jgi:hypothetical protein
MAPKFVCFFYFGIHHWHDGTQFCVYRFSGSITWHNNWNSFVSFILDPSRHDGTRILCLSFDSMEAAIRLWINIIDTLSGTIMRLCYIHWSQLNIVYPENEAGFPLTISSNCKGWSRTIVLQACQRGKNSQYLPWLIRTKLRIHST